MTRTLYGEYLAMLLLLLSLAVAVIFAAAVGQFPVRASLGLIAALWISFRVGGLAAGKVSSVVCTSVLLAVCCGFFYSDETFNAGVRSGSIPVLTAILTVVFWVDVSEIYLQHAADIAVRNRTRVFVTEHGIRILWYGFFGFVVIYAVLIPLVQEWLLAQSPPADDPRQMMDRMSLPQTVLFRIFECGAALFFFVLGACVGSFLNVVVYRVPLGISVLVKPSHCPGCSEKIKGRDNMPIVGWLKLKGRCRSCETEISPRYPSVELIVGLIFLLLYFVELISGGANLPGRNPNFYNGVLWILFYTKWDLVGLYSCHCVLICTIISWALIRWDGHRVPPTSVLFMFAICAVPLFVWPNLQLLPGIQLQNVSADSFADVAMTMGLGMLAGVCVIGVDRLLRSAFDLKLIPGHVPS